MSFLQSRQVSRSRRDRWIRLAAALTCLMAGAAQSAEKLVRHEVKYGETTRAYYVYVPEILKDLDNRQAILTFGDKGMKPSDMHKMIDAESEASDYGFVLIYPVPVDGVWNAGKGSGAASSETDEDTFLVKLLDVLPKRHKIKPDRVFAMGYGDGAQMVARAACTQSARIRGAAMVAHTMNEWGCNPDHKIAMMFLHGVKDKIIPITGGTKFKFTNFNDQVGFFRKVNELKSAARTVYVNDTLKCLEYRDKKRHDFVTGCRMYNDGHQWPGGKRWGPKVFGSVNESLDASWFIMRRFYKLKAKKEMRSDPALLSHGAVNAGMTSKQVQALLDRRAKRMKRSLETKAEREARNAPRKAKPSPAAPAQASRRAVPTTPRPRAVAPPAGIAPSPGSASTSGSGATASRPAYDFKQQTAVFGKTTLRYAVLKPAVELPREDLSITFFFGPKEFSPEKAANALDAERFASIHRNVFVYVPMSESAAPDTLDAIYLAADQITRDLGLETPMLFAIGLSDGGRPVQDLYCQDPSGFRAMATLGYAWRDEACAAEPKLPLLVSQSKDDRRHPYAGGRNGTLSHEAAIDRQIRRHGELLRPHVVSRDQGHVCTEYRDGNANGVLWSCTQTRGGSGIPGARIALGAEFGDARSDFDGPRYVFDFVNQFEPARFSFSLDRNPYTAATVSDF